MTFFDTIVACITGSQRAAVAVIRVSGPEAWAVGKRVFENWKEPVPERLAQYGRFSHGDDGLCIAFAEGHSYTGEQSAEFSVHGSPASVAALVSACEAAGARLALPGEFTQRAFLNGRLDLAQAEAVRSVVDAETSAQFRSAHRNLEGALSRSVREVASQLTRVLVAVEASTDFSEEIGDLDTEMARSLLVAARNEVGALLDRFAASKPLREGATVVIAGEPNVGKSSLFNAVLGYDRAIVTPIPGTTRDVIGARLELDGVVVQLMDTAGLREATDQVEQIGIELSRREMESADIVWFVSEASSPRPAPTLSVPVLEVRSKADLAPGADGLLVSSLTGAGLCDLLNETRALLGDQFVEGGVSTARQAESLQHALASIDEALRTLQDHLPTDLFSVCLRSALDALSQITGETVSADILERIFHDFCIGK